MPFKLMDFGDQFPGELGEKGKLTEFDGSVELYSVYVNQMSTHLLSLLCF